MTAWLLKTEPGEFSFADLEQAAVEPWDGVTNPGALKNLRAARTGDPCVIYHSGTERRAVGLGEVARTAYPDPNASDPKHVVVDVRSVGPLARPVPLEMLKGDPRFAGSDLVRLPRLSVVPLDDDQYAAILELGNGI